MKFRNSIFQYFLSFFQRADAAFNQVFGEKGNFLYYLGSLPIILLFVLLFTGLFMFIYYNMSAGQSYESVKYMTESALFGRFVRNLHRYAADAMMFFVILHMARMLFEEKFQNHRALAWVTGLIILALMLVQGVTGYILPLDSNARYVMEKTSELLAGLKVFGDTLPRSFSSPALLGKWIMWVIMIIHFAIPLFFIVLLFLHVLRVSRAKIFPPRKITYSFLGMLALFTLIFPIQMVGKAEAEKVAELVQPDWFYLFFAAVFDSRHGWIIWSAMAATYLLLLFLPKILKKREILKAVVDADKCTGCGLCAVDCPYEAMTMIERKDESRFKHLVEIDTALCAGCGVCSGSCNWDALTYPNPGAAEKEIDWSPAQGKWVALFCQGRAHSLGMQAVAEPLREFAPGAVAHVMPCTGKLGASMTEKIRAGGAKGIVVGACANGDCWYREGNKWLQERIAANRKPVFRKTPPEFPLIGVRFTSVQKKDAQKAILEIIEKQTLNGKSLPTRFFAMLKPSTWAHSFAMSTVFFALTVWVFFLGASGRFGALKADSSQAMLRLDFFYQTLEETCSPDKIPPGAEKAELDRIAGLIKLDQLTPDARENLLRQAREGVAGKYCSRARRLLDIIVKVDGKELARRTFNPSGLHNDGITYVLMKEATTPGQHAIAVEAHEKDSASHGRSVVFSETLSFAGGEVKLLDYNPNTAKFYWRTTIDSTAGGSK
ncbi:MAG: cytochrome b N-terminal domain-containing protein [Spirochaetes bacterium]|nr:cytochrome b N-terminal domain-containing protein [Spirochaetota bacterium]